MEAEFTKQFAALAARQNPEGRAIAGRRRRPARAIAAHNGETGASESLAQLPPCRINAQPR